MPNSASNLSLPPPPLLSSHIHIWLFVVDYLFLSFFFLPNVTVSVVGYGVVQLDELCIYSKFTLRSRMIREAPFSFSFSFLSFSRRSSGAELS